MPNSTKYTRRASAMTHLEEITTVAEAAVYHTYLLIDFGVIKKEQGMDCERLLAQIPSMSTMECLTRRAKMGDETYEEMRTKILELLYPDVPAEQKRFHRGKEIWIMLDYLGNYEVKKLVIENLASSPLGCYTRLNETTWFYEKDYGYSWFLTEAGAYKAQENARRR